MKTMNISICSRISDALPRGELAQALHTGHTVRQGRHLYRVVGGERRLVGVLTHGNPERFVKGGTEPPRRGL
jgi:hypothetical protein